MESFFNNNQVLYAIVKKVIDELAEEKHFGDLKDGEIIDSLEAIIDELI